MNGRDFDQITRTVVGQASDRRTLVQRLLGGVAAATLARLGLGGDDAAAQDVGTAARCKPAGRKCESNKDCCGVARCKRGKCRCKRKATLCDGVCSNLNTDRLNCGACGRRCNQAGKECVAGFCTEIETGAGSNVPDGPAGMSAKNTTFAFADSGKHRVRFLTADGGFNGDLGEQGNGDGQFNQPLDVAFHPTENDIFVADTGNHRIQRLKSNGEFITKWGSFGSGVDQFKDPKGIAVSNRTVIVANSGAHEIKRFSENGFFLSKFGRRGSGQGQFEAPTGVAVDAARNIYVADTGNNRV